MKDLSPVSQINLYGLDIYLNELIRLYTNKSLPNKILLSGQKGSGKSTLAYHFINYVLSQNEDHQYDIQNSSINLESSVYKTINNKSNTNLINIDVNTDKKFIDINQIRDLINRLNKSSFNNKPRFILIDNIDLLNTNSINALLKVLEEPSENTYFILIHSNKKILSTLLSRCINFRLTLSNKDCINIANKLLGDNLDALINNDLLDYYITPGEIYHLVKFAHQNDYDLSNIDLKNFLKILIENGHYKKDPFISIMIYKLIEFYFRKLNPSLSKIISEKYSYFVRRIYDTKIFNLDQESLFLEFNEEILNG